MKQIPELKAFDFQPCDTLFFRDQRPMAAGARYGHGANWPFPPVIHSAVRTALLRRCGCLRQGPTRGYQRYGRDSGTVGALEFNWLRTAGPFPVRRKNGHDELLLPRPLDLVPGRAGDGSLELMKLIPPARDDLPGMLTYRVASFGPLTKHAEDSQHRWMTIEEMEAYLKMGKDDVLRLSDKGELWDTEYRIGLAVDPETHTAVERHLYAAEHLRLRDGVRLRFYAGEPPTHKERPPAEKNLLPRDLHKEIITLGGEARFGRVIYRGDPLQVPTVELKDTRFIKWVLLTPAIFERGWRPGWVDDDGRVRLHRFSREERRTRRRERRGPQWKPRSSSPDAAARLVAARVGKPLVVGGWNLVRAGKNQDDPGGKPTRLAVPAGSVYYFRTSTPEEAARLIALLHGRFLSDFFGEKGMGLGVCGSWEPTEFGFPGQSRDDHRPPDPSEAEGGS